MHTEVGGFWDEEKIAYYDRASRDTFFHTLLFSEIKKHIEKEDRIVELGAGLGYVTSLLKEEGYEIKAYDNCRAAVESANRRTGYELVEYADAEDMKNTTDVLLMVFFGGLSKERNLERYLRLSKKIIYIISAHTGYSESKRKDRSKEVELLLKSKELLYEKIVIDCEFNQPLKDKKDAERFFQISYGSTILPSLAESDDKEFPLLFRNRKRIYMYIIKRRKE